MQTYPRIRTRGRAKLCSSDSVRQQSHGFKFLKRSVIQNQSGYISYHYKSSGKWWVPEISLQLSYCFIFFIHFHSPWNSWVPWFPQVTELTFNISTLEIVHGFLTLRIVQRTKQVSNHSNCGREKDKFQLWNCSVFLILANVIFIFYMWKIHWTCTVTKVYLYYVLKPTSYYCAVLNTPFLSPLSFPLSLYQSTKLPLSYENL